MAKCQEREIFQKCGEKKKNGKSGDDKSTKKITWQISKYRTKSPPIIKYSSSPYTVQQQ